LKKRKKRFYSLHLISTEKDRPTVFNFSLLTVRIIFGGLIVILITILIFVILSIPKALKYDKLLAENKQLIQNWLKVTKILSDYNQILKMDHYIRSVLGPELAISSMDSSMLDSLMDSLYVNDDPGDKQINISYLSNIPIYPPVQGYITQGFVDDFVFSDDNHYGVDIVEAEGTPIKAAASGVVVFANWIDHFGYTVIMYHSYGYFTIYGHNQRNLVEDHQYVQRGEVIAFLGNTGISDGPHLHFEIWRNGTPIDPREIIYSYRDSDISIDNTGR